MSDHPVRVCAVITSTTCREARASIERAASTADIAELRLDYLTDFNFPNPDALAPILEGKRIPVIITCRAVDEGGTQNIEDSIRLPLLVRGATSFADFCDIEASRYEQAAPLNPDLSKLLVSWHNFAETPADIEDHYARITRLPAAIYKIATRASDITDALSIFKLLDRARREKRNLIALAMGQPGIMTRILGPSYGSFLTYSSVDQGGESAPGQLTVEELVSEFRVRSLNSRTRIAGVIGYPVGHSVSPAMHNAALALLGLNAVYLPFEVADLVSFFKKFLSAESRELSWLPLGFSVTIPHKRTVIPLLDEIDETSRRVGAVNTVVVRDGRLVGCNTDVQGAMAPLTSRISLAGRHCAVIGSGGSARAVAYGLLGRGARVTLFVRDMAEASLMANDLQVEIASIDSLTNSNAEILVNCTPVGMRGHSEGKSPVDRSALRGRRLVYDLVYNPLQTRLLSDAEAEGCRTISGIEMLVEQAALQFQAWTGKSPPIDVMRQAALNKLSH